MKSIKHTLGERNTVVMRALIQEVGIKGFGVYWYLLEEIKEKTILEINDNFYQLYGVLFKIDPQELEIIIITMLRYNIFVMEGERLSTLDLVSVKEIRSKAGIKAMENRWGSKENKKVIEETKTIENKEKPVDKLEELIKKAVAKQPLKEVKEIKKLTPVKRNKNQSNPDILLSSDDFKELEKMEVKEMIKQQDFLPLFNAIKLEYKPNSKGNQALSATDLKNLKKLISIGYTKQDFEKAIHGQMRSKWVIENDMQVPTHILRNENFVRYLEKSTFKKEIFKENLTDEPIYNE